MYNQQVTTFSPSGSKLFATPTNMQIIRYPIFFILIILCIFLPCFSWAVEQGSSIHINTLVDSDILVDSDDHALPSDEVQDSLNEAQVNLDEVKFSLDDLLNIALANNQSLEVVRQKLAQSHGRLTQARSGYLPHLSLEGNYSYTHRKDSASSIDYINSGSDTEQQATTVNESEEDDVVRGAATISQLLYDFGKTTGAIDVGKLNLKAADAYLQRQVQDVIFQTKEAYYNVLEKKRLVDVAQESVKILTDHRDQAKVYHHAGMRTRIDVINADVELSKANMSLLQTKYSLKTARVALEQILGKRPFQGNYEVHSDKVDLDNILTTMPSVSDNLKNLIGEAMKHRPDILQRKHLAKAARANLQQVKGDYWPTINAEANYEDYDTDLSLFKDSWEVGLACRWELFSGLHTEGAAAEAQAILLENKAQLRDQQLLVIKEVTDNYLQAEETRQSVRIAMQTLELARENLVLADKRYQSGTYNVVEYNDAQFSLTQARSDLVVTYYGYLTAVAGIEHAIGSYSSSP